MRDNFESTEEFIESVKTDIFPDEIYVFTPQGKIIEMSGGSTAIDFAYAVTQTLVITAEPAELIGDLRP